MSETNGRSRVAPHTEDVGTDYPGAFPNSRKVYVEGSRGIRVPMREIHLTGGEPPLRVYDSSGPQGVDVRQGHPAGVRRPRHRRRSGIENDPWNLIRFKPAEGARRRGLKPPSPGGGGRRVSPHAARLPSVTCPEVE